MKYAGLLTNDFVNGEGVCVSVWTQGCPHHCPGCHNPQTWSFEGGREDTIDSIINQILNAITANGIERNFSVLGGEPLCPSNLDMVSTIIATVRAEHPNIKIFLWTGYTTEELAHEYGYNESLNLIYSNIDVLIEGPFIKAERDITLPLRGSRNQRVIRLDHSKI